MKSNYMLDVTPHTMGCHISNGFGADSSQKAVSSETISSVKKTVCQRGMSANVLDFCGWETGPDILGITHRDSPEILATSHSTLRTFPQQPQI